MKGLIAAIQFITILPVGKQGTYDPKGMIFWFPVVGLVLGVLLAAFDLVISRWWSPSVTSVLDVVFLAAITGAFHIDGLGDTADGLLGHRSPEKALEIMKDSRIGAMGLVAILGALAVKWGGISSLAVHRSLILVIVPAYARAGMIFGIRFLDYGRPLGGTAHGLFGDSVSFTTFGALVFPILLSLSMGWRGVLLNLSFAGVVTTLLFWYKKRMGCITGDMLGALCETTESLLFLLVAMGGGS